jgi:TolB-like protein
MAPLSGPRVKSRYLPREFFRSQSFGRDRTYTVAVIPFLNRTETTHAGNILTSQFIGQLLRAENFTVVELGLVREQLLKYRMIMQEGPSLANTDIIASEESLGADLVFSGTVYDYQLVGGVPKVDFSVKIIDTNSREVVWASRSYNSGEEGVFFFDLGRVHTAHQLALDMARGTVELLAR